MKGNTLFPAKEEERLPFPSSAYVSFRGPRRQLTHPPPTPTQKGDEGAYAFSAYGRVFWYSQQPAIRNREEEGIDDDDAI